MTERGAGLPRWSLSPVEILSAPYVGGAGAADWFGPSAPQAPGAPAEVAGRQWDFPSGFNLNVAARAYEAFSFADLRALAEAYDLLRLVIETRKDQIERLTWTIRAKSGRSVDPAQMARVEKFFASPDGAHDFSAWMRMILEDLFVIDAPALWCERDRSGSLIALHPLDGATIKPVLDAWGRTPRPFVQNGGKVYPVAFQQILKGLPAIDYSVRDLLYRPRNVRAHRAYGFSPVEQVMATVNIGLKRQLSQLSYYSEGNIPESLIGVPDAWTPDQIKNFQDYWDLYFTGDQARRRRAKFVPGGVAKTFIQTKEPELKNAFDEWIARVVCFAFSVSPQPFVTQMNRATSETQKDSADEEGLLPVLNWIKRLCDHVIQNLLGATDLEFSWRHEPVIDPSVQRENLVAYVNAGMMTRKRAAEIMGETIPDDPMADVLTVTTGQGVVKLGGDSGQRAVGKREGGFNDGAATADKYSPGQPRGADGKWIGAFDIFSGTRRDNIVTRKPFNTSPRPQSVVAMNIEAGSEGGKNDTPEEDLSEEMFGTGPTGQANHGRTLTPDMPAAGGYGAPASGFTGNLGFQFQSPAGVPPRNDPATIDGIPYSGHALDQMQNRGLFPSVTGQAIRNGLQGRDKNPDASVFYDPVNDVSVVRDNVTGNVITVMPTDRRRGSK